MYMVIAAATPAQIHWMSRNNMDSNGRFLRPSSAYAQSELIAEYPRELVPPSGAFVAFPRSSPHTNLLATPEQLAPDYTPGTRVYATVQTRRARFHRGDGTFVDFRQIRARRVWVMNRDAATRGIIPHLQFGWRVSPPSAQHVLPPPDMSDDEQDGHGDA
jgi:hypothetical protein